jgi:hypothetical protein
MSSIQRRRNPSIVNSMTIECILETLIADEGTILPFQIDTIGDLPVQGNCVARPLLEGRHRNGGGCGAFLTEGAMLSQLISIHTSHNQRSTY